MWDKRELLLAAIIFTAGYYIVTVMSIDLDMAEDAVDDRYDGCREKAMETFIHSGMLAEELKKNEDLQKAWESNTKCSKPIPGGEAAHSTALSVYGHGDANFIRGFNSLVKTHGVNVSTYENDFHYKSFHFLLMDSLMLLGSKNCTTVYFVTEENYKAEKGSKVRFGTFNAVYLKYMSCKKSTDLDGMFFFKIESCFFLNLEEKSCTEDMALLSPAEVFTVEDVHKKRDEDSEYTEIVLKHSGVHSNHNCYSFSRSPANVSTEWLVCLLLYLFFFQF